MKQPVRGQSEEYILRKYPIKRDIEGWYFRKKETSNGAWVVEGTDRWGRIVSASGEDPDNLLHQCVESARQIEKQLSETKNS